MRSQESPDSDQKRGRGRQMINDKMFSFEQLEFRPQWQFADNRSGVYYRNGVIPGTLLYSSLGGSIRLDDVQQVEPCLNLVFAEAGLSNSEYVRIVDYSGVRTASIRARKHYAQILKRLNQEYNCRPKVTYICGASILIRAALQLFAAFVKQSFVFVDSVEQAFAELNQTDERSTRDAEEEVKVHPEDIRTFAAMCGALLWDEQREEAEQKAGLPPDHPLYEAAKMVAVVRDDLNQLRRGDKEQQKENETFIAKIQRLNTELQEQQQQTEEKHKILLSMMEDAEEARSEALAASERHQASEKFLRDVLESIQDGVSVLSPDLTIRHVNSTMNTWYADQLPLEGQKCFQAYHGADRPCDPCPTLRCLESGQTENDVVPGPPGSEHEWLELPSFPMKNDTTGQTEGVIEFVRDVTSRFRAEEQLRTLHRAVEQGSSTIVITDTDGSIEYANPQFETITGYTLQEAKGQNPRILKSGKHPPEFYEELWTTITSGRVWRGELINKKKDDTLYWESACISPVFDGQGNITHYVAIKEDVTDRKRKEEELRQINEQLEQQTAFANSMAAEAEMANLAKSEFLANN